MENIQENSENNKPKEDVDYIKTVKCIKTPKSELNDKKITCIIRKYYEVSKGFFESNYISYEIFTQECSWVANRRYSDFIWLRDCLRMLFPAEIVPMLPKKKIGNRRFDDDFILKRLKHLQNFLNIIVQNENFKSCSPLYLFLSIGDRTVFEQHMKEIVPIPFPSIETLLNFEGNVKIIDFENEGYQFQESFYKNINKYFKVQNESLIELRKNVKEYFGYLNEAGNCLTNIRDIFGKLHTLNKQATISPTMTKIYEAYESFFKNYSRIQNNQGFIINETLKPFIQKMTGVSEPFSEILDQQEEIKAEYDSLKKTLDAKKDSLWKLGTIDKWELNEIKDTVDRAMLLQDKNYAYKKMCYDKTQELLKVYNKLGYFYYSNSEQFNEIIKKFENDAKINVKVFVDKFGPTINDSVQIYSELASCEI